MKVLVVSSEWPSAAQPHRGSYIIEQVESLKRLGITAEAFPIDGRKNPLNYLRARVRMTRSLRHGRFHLIHGHFGHNGFVCLGHRGIPCVMTFHGSDVLGSVAANGRYTLLGGALTRVSAIVAKYADTAIIVAEHFKKFLPRREYHVLPTGVDLEKFRPLGMKLARSRLGMKLDVPIILFGAPPSTAVKRFALAREVWKRVRAKHVNCELLCLDKVPHSVVPLYINAADCLLLTSFHEGSPTIVKEALACNVPIVSVDVGDVRCRVKGLKECFVSESLDPEALARAVIASFRARPTFEGRHAVVDLDLPRIAERLLSIYESSLRKAAERSGGTRASVHVER